jgi:hypothetical protein
MPTNTADWFLACHFVFAGGVDYLKIDACFGDGESKKCPASVFSLKSFSSPNKRFLVIV